MKKIAQNVALLSPTFLLLVMSCEMAERPTAVAGDDRVSFAQDEHSKDFDNYVVHVNALTTDQLPADVAKGYGISRSGNRVMLNVVVTRKEEGKPGVPISGNVLASATNLTGQLKNLSMREVTEGVAIYYIGELPVADRETLIFDIDVTPVEQPRTYHLRYKRQFYTD